MGRKKKFVPDVNDKICLENAWSGSAPGLDPHKINAEPTRFEYLYWLLGAAT